MWSDLNEAEGAYMHEWIEQCRIREAEASLPMLATMSLYVGMFPEEKIPTTVLVHVTKRKTLMAETTVKDLDGWMDDDRRGYDVFALIPCCEVRALLGEQR
jgi:hypothetical protein